MKWVWDESAGQYIQVNKVDSTTQKVVTDKEDIAYLDKRKAQFEEAKKQVMDRVKKDIADTSNEYDPKKASQESAGADRAFARMAFYKSAFLNQKIDRFSPEPTHDDIMSYGLVDNKLLDYFSGREHSQNLLKAFQGDKDLLSFEKFNPKDMEPGAYTFMEKMDKAMPEAVRMRTLSECLDKMISTNGLFFNEDTPEYKTLLDASKKLKKFMKQNPGISPENEAFQKPCKEVSDAADHYDSDKKFRFYFRSNYGQRQGCKFNLKNALSDVMEPAMPQIISELKEEERKQNELKAQEREKRQKSIDNHTLEKAKATAARKMASAIAEKQNRLHRLKFIDGTRMMLQNADWFQDATKDWTAEDVRLVEDPNYNGPAREKLNKVHEKFRDLFPQLEEEVKKQDEIELRTLKQGVAEKMSESLAEALHPGNEKEFRDQVRDEIASSVWFQDATKDLTADDARTLNDPNYKGPIRGKLNQVNAAFGKEYPKMMDELEKKLELEKKNEPEKKNEVEKKNEPQKKDESQKEQKAEQEITPEERANRRIQKIAKRIAILEAKRCHIPEDEHYQEKITMMTKKIQASSWFQDATKGAAASGLGNKEVDRGTKEFLVSVLNRYNKELDAHLKKEAAKTKTNVRQTKTPQKKVGNLTA